MQVKAGDLVEHSLSRHIDRDLRRQGLDKVGDLGRAMGGQQQGQRPHQGRGGQCAQHQLTLGDEAPLLADQVALADVAKGGDLRVFRVLDRDDHGAGLSADRRLREARRFGSLACMSAHDQLARMIDEAHRMVVFDRAPPASPPSPACLTSAAPAGSGAG